MKKIFIILLIIVSSVHAKESFYETSYDCTKTSGGSVEHSVCTDETLAKLDKELSSIYTSFYYVTKEIKSDQRAWMKQKNRCKDSACIQKAYESRIVDLNASLTNEKTFPQSVLEAMKLAQMSDMRQLKSKEIANIPYDDKKNKAFQDDLFRFRNITFKTPIIAEIKDYNDPKLKAILKECYGYRFDLYVVENAIRILELQPQEDHYLSPNPKFNFIRNPVEDLNLYVWKLNAKGKEWLFVRPKLADGYDYVIDPNYCTKLRYDGDVAQALNKDKQFIKHTFFPARGENRILTYKNKEFGFGFSSTQEPINLKNASFGINDFLEVQKVWEEQGFIGAPVAAIFFRVKNFHF